MAAFELQTAEAGDGGILGRQQEENLWPFEETPLRKGDMGLRERDHLVQGVKSLDPLACSSMVGPMHTGEKRRREAVGSAAWEKKG